MLRDTSITQEMINQGFLSLWEEKQHEIIEEQIMPVIQRLEIFSKKCNSFEQKLTTIKPLQLCFDKEKMNAHGLLEMSEHFKSKINYDKLFKWFSDVMPELINALYTKSPWSLSQLKKESQLMDQWLRRAHTLLIKIDMITLEFPLEISRTSKQAKVSQRSKVNSWCESLILTPKMRCPEQKQNVRINIWNAIPPIDSPMRKIPQNKSIINEETSGRLNHQFVHNDDLNIQIIVT